MLSLDATDAVVWEIKAKEWSGGRGGGNRIDICELSRRLIGGMDPLIGRCLSLRGEKGILNVRWMGSYKALKH